EDNGIAELSLRRNADELFVGQTTPQKVSQPRRQFEVTDFVCRLGCRTRRLLFKPEDKFWLGQHRFKSRSDAFFESAILFATAIEAHQALQILGIDGTAESLSR